MTTVTAVRHTRCSPNISALCPPCGFPSGEGSARNTEAPLRGPRRSSYLGTASNALDQSLGRASWQTRCGCEGRRRCGGASSLFIGGAQWPPRDHILLIRPRAKNPHLGSEPPVTLGSPENVGEPGVRAPSAVGCRLFARWWSGKAPQTSDDPEIFPCFRISSDHFLNTYRDHSQTGI
ncbi:hypothetical protein EYF80_039046 [Liparis tanakae]|uniref:Uncharacterized protein n=1 Tax=Liparis tanakae TaxID=230148 RepID=A0A4Z2GC83_9TELE|nr:hypothetical protein EYF80_039046 [Liparis tanakae]